METEYKVRLEIFEGPLDLLLYLIKRDEIDIYDISLSGSPGNTSRRHGKRAASKGQAIG